MTPVNPAPRHINSFSLQLTFVIADETTVHTAVLSAIMNNPTPRRRTVFRYMVEYRLFLLMRKLRLHWLAIPMAEHCRRHLASIRKEAVRNGAYVLVRFTEPEAILAHYLRTHHRKIRHSRHLMEDSIYVYKQWQIRRQYHRLNCSR
jgi:hypothetical protein